MISITYRTNDGTRWGTGKGSNVDADEVDVNFWNIVTAVQGLIDNPLTPKQIESVEVTGTSLTFYLTGGVPVGPVTLPTLTWTWRGNFTIDTEYHSLDWIHVPTLGIYLIVSDHTSGSVFDPDLEDIDGDQVYLRIAPPEAFAAAVSVAELTDVLLTAIADNQILRWDTASGKWQNETPGTMIDQNADAVAITGGTITGLPTPIVNSDAATKGYVDSLSGLVPIGNNQLEGNISGGSDIPVGLTLTQFLDSAISNTRGAVIVRGAAGWLALAPGTVGQFLRTGGSGADVTWAAAGAGVTNVASGTGLAGGPITATGTLTLAAAADGTVLANVSGGSAIPLPTTISALLDKLSSTRGSLLTRTAAGWVSLGPGSSGQYLKTQGAGADATWDSPAGAGTVTSVATGTGLTGGPISASGTILFASIADSNLLANISGGSAAPVPTTFSLFLDHVLSSTRGAVLYRGVANWSALAPGTSGQFLKTLGTGADPAWDNAPSGSAIADKNILSNISGGSALPVGHTLTDILDNIVGSNRGYLLFRNASGWVGLAPGTIGQILTTGGPSADPSWTTVSGASTTLAALTDVNITTASDQAPLIYEASSSKWIDGDPASLLTAIADNRILANTSGGSARPIAKTISQVLDLLGATNGAVPYRSGGSWGELLITLTALADTDILIYDSGSGEWHNHRQHYDIASYVPGVLTASQDVLGHPFSKGVTFPANFGAYLGRTTVARSKVAATASTTFKVQKAASATPTAFSDVGTIVFAAGAAVATFTTSGGTALTFAQGDVIGLVAPVSADATLAGVSVNLVGFET